MKVFVIFVFGVVVSICAGCGTEFRRAENTYQNEILKIKAQSPDADFLALRMAFTTTAAYRPYDETEDALSGELYEALSHDQPERCATIADTLLQENYTSLNGHYAAMLCNMKLGNNQAARYHRYVLKGLLKSIGNSGDGRSPESAYITISTLETKAFVRLIGLEIKKQVLIRKNGKSFDVVSVRYPESGDEFELTFDVNIQMAQYSADR